jgi:enoyl-[acyl-carrier protein] reductase II
MIRTPLCEMLGIEHPIVQGGMAWAATPELAAAVSNAGGFGIVGAGNSPPDVVRHELRRVRELTSRPFGANVPLFTAGAEETVQAFIDEQVAVVTTGGGSAGPYLEPLQRAGILVIPVVASVALARRMARLGVDALIAEGMESGGHVGDVATLPLVPQVVDAVDIPVIAAGGIADGRGLAAALALGAVGVQMGTRFICTTECQAHPNYKGRILRAHDRATMVTGRSVGHPVRSIRGPFVRRFGDLERAGASDEEVMALGAGSLSAAMIHGDIEQGSVMAGQSAGLVDDVIPVQALIERTVREAETIIRQNAAQIRSGASRAES